jgi:hypothetical protein
LKAALRAAFKIFSVPLKASIGCKLFVFSDGRLLAELIQAQKVVVNGEEKFQKRTANRYFTEQQRKRLEDAAKNGGKNILPKFK